MDIEEGDDQDEQSSSSVISNYSGFADVVPVECPPFVKNKFDDNFKL